MRDREVCEADMEDISGFWESFSLTNKEEVPFDFGHVEEGDHYYLAAQFMTNRVLNLESMVRTFTPLWRAESGFTARTWGLIWWSSFLRMSPTWKEWSNLNLGLTKNI